MELLYTYDVLLTKYRMFGLQMQLKAGKHRSIDVQENQPSKQPSFSTHCQSVLCELFTEDWQRIKKENENWGKDKEKKMQMNEMCFENGIGERCKYVKIRRFDFTEE